MSLIYIISPSSDWRFSFSQQKHDNLQVICLKKQSLAAVCQITQEIGIFSKHGLVKDKTATETPDEK